MLAFCACFSSSRRRVSLALPFLVPLMFFAVSSCSVTDYVGAYFNTYYNAKHLFDEAERETFTLMDSRPGGRNWLTPFAISAGTRTKFDKVIEKCSKLLQYHPKASLVDDALMMIGKAYYYEDENQRAERKFREIIQTYPGGNLALESQLLLATVFYRMDKRDDARTEGRQVLETATKDGENEILGRVSLLLAQMDVEDKNYSSATEYYELAAKNGASSEERSSAYLRVAEMYTKIGDFANAEAAYRNAESEGGTYVNEYRGKIGALRMRAKQGKYASALDGLRDLRSDSKYKEFFGEIELEMGNVYRDKGDLQSALDQYRLVGSKYPRTESSAKAYFELGNVFESNLLQYDSASVAYSKSKSEFPTAEITSQARDRADYMAKYLTFSREIQVYDSLLTARLVHNDTTAAPGPEDSTSKATPLPRQTPAPAPSLSPDSINAKLAVDENELGGLFYVMMGKMDSAEYWYRRVITDHPESPYVPRALYTLAQIYSRDSSAQTKTVDSLYRTILRKYPGSEFSAATRRILGLPPVKPEKDAAEETYLIGEKLLLGGDADAAKDTFAAIVSRFPESPYASRALYATGWLYENQLSLPDSARSAYERLVAKYPASPYAENIRGRMLHEPPQEKKGEGVQGADSLKNARPPDQLPVPGRENVPREGRGRPERDEPPTLPPPAPSNPQPREPK